MPQRAKSRHRQPARATLGGGFVQQTVKLRLLLWAMRGAGLLLFLGAMAGWLFPDFRLWGVHHLAFLPLPLAIVCVAAGALMLSPWGASVVALLSRRLSFWTHRPAALWAAVALVVFLLLRVSVPLLGDGQLWIRELAWVGEFGSRGRPVPEGRLTARKEPLELAAHQILFQAISLLRPQLSKDLSAKQLIVARQRRQEWFRDAASWSYAILSSLAGAATVLMTLAFARWHVAPPGRPAFMAMLFAGGGVLLFFGYAENYSCTSLGVVACLLMGVVESAKPQRFPWRFLLLWILSLAFHYAAIVLAPALLYRLAIWVRHAVQPRGDHGGNRRFTRAFAAALILAAGIGYVATAAWRGHSSILPLLPQWSRDGYALLSSAHLADLANILILVSFSSLCVLLFLRARTSPPDATTTMLGLAVAGSLVFVLLFDPNLGMTRDWDLYALALWPVIVWGAWKLAQADLGEHHSEILAKIFGMALLVTVPFVLVNAMTKSSVSRFETLLHLDRSRSGYGWENLALHYQRVNDHDDEIRAWREAVNVNATPRYMINLGNALRETGRLDEAQPWYVSACRQQPEFTEQMYHLAFSYHQRGEVAKAREVVRLMIELDSTDTRWRELLAGIEKQIPEPRSDTLSGR
jgi:hypothetical protein